MKKYLKDYIQLLSIAGCVLLLDQLTKQWVHSNLMIGEVYRPDLWLSLYVRLIHWKNTGAAFGMFQSLGNIFSILSFVVSAAILYYFPQIPRQDWLIRLSLGLLLGGAMGNLIDRLTRGYVTDFISISILPVFNIADFSISAGVVLLFIGMLLQERRNKKKTDSTSTDKALEEEAAAQPLPEEYQGE